MMESELFKVFGPWAVSLIILVVALRWFMSRTSDVEKQKVKAEEQRLKAEVQRDEARDKQVESLISTMRESFALLARAVDRFESFEREEIRTHAGMFSGMQALVDSQNRIIETQSRLGETLARISDTQMQQKVLMRDIVRELREARRDRREAAGLPPEEGNGFVQAVDDA